MPKKLNGTQLSEKEVYEIWKLRNEGCPCCKCPVRLKTISEKYGVSESMASRIGTLIYRSNYEPEDE